jgi:site-specific recombinase XerD
MANSVGKNKISRYLYDLVNIARWLDKPFEKATKKDMEKIMMKLEDVKGEKTNRPYSEWTKKGYRIIVRKFYKWMKGTKIYPEEVDWIKTGMKECNRKLPEDMLSEEEVLALINSCQHSRDKALIAMLFDSGCRVGELLNMRVRDIEYFDKGMKIYLTGKTGMRKVPVIFSVHYLNTWLNEHPTKKIESYVWVKNDGKRLSYGRVRDLLRDCAKRTKISKKVNPHNFRHSRASIYSDKLKDRVMMEYFGWKTSEIISTYSHLNGKQIENAVLEAIGIVPEDKKEKTLLKPKTCLRCKKVHEATALFCNCGYPLDEKQAQEIKIKEMQREKADVIMDKIVNDPEVWELIKKKLNC